MESDIGYTKYKTFLYKQNNFSSSEAEVSSQSIASQSRPWGWDWGYYHFKGVGLISGVLEGAGVGLKRPETSYFIRNFFNMVHM